MSFDDNKHVIGAVPQRCGMPFAFRTRHSAFDTLTRAVIDSARHPEESDSDFLVNEWMRIRPASGGMPHYDAFDILNIPGRLWPHVCVTSLERSPRRFFVRMIGTAIEANNGFYGNQRYMSTIPLKNRHVMEREFAWTVHLEAPVLSEGPYIGATDYVKSVRRVITPYKHSGNEYAFVFHADFAPLSGQERRMRSP